jgi:threonine dehydratase
VISRSEYQHLIRASHVYSGAVRTPLDKAPHLSELCGAAVWLKREDLQPIFSFKLRGAFNYMASLPQKELVKGVAAASAGNHAQGVALSAKILETHAVIVVPLATPEIKQKAIRDLGSELICHGDTFGEAYEHARALAHERGLTFVHPYDEPLVIAGQGTIGLELLDQCRQQPDAVFVPVGGGGLISGIGLAIKDRWPETKLIGVEPKGACAMKQSLAQGKRILLDQVDMLADGVAVKQVGEETLRLCTDLIDEIVLVDGDEICAGVKQIFEDRRAVTEPSGALAWAGMKKWCAENDAVGKNLVAILSGANTGFDRLRYIAERAQIGEEHEGVLAISIPEKPGAFRTLCAHLGSHNITEFNYRMGEAEKAVVYAGIAIKERSELSEVAAQLKQKGYGSVDLTDDDIAKTHIRHMVGGRTTAAEGERVFHFHFPERQGALSHFLNHLPENWSITLFHYRCHGSVRARVLAGILTPDGMNDRLNEFLDEVHFPVKEVTSDPAIRLFLQ